MKVRPVRDTNPASQLLHVVPTIPTQASGIIAALLSSPNKRLQPARCAQAFSENGEIPSLSLMFVVLLLDILPFGHRLTTFRQYAHPQVLYRIHRNTERNNGHKHILTSQESVTMLMK